MVRKEVVWIDCVDGREWGSFEEAKEYENESQGFIYKCDNCQGKGIIKGEPIKEIRYKEKPCPHCSGRGYVETLSSPKMVGD